MKYKDLEDEWRDSWNKMTLYALDNPDYVSPSPLSKLIVFLPITLYHQAVKIYQQITT